MILMKTKTSAFRNTNMYFLLLLDDVLLDENMQVAVHIDYTGREGLVQAFGKEPGEDTSGG
jgi:hypothetical protein